MKRIAIAVAVLALSAVAAHQAIPHTHGASIARPAESEFGFGPRTSAGGRFTATLSPSAPVSVGQMQSMQLYLADSTGKTVNHALITVEGSMPQHGHGLPTQPRAVVSSDDGMYEIDGIKFNMGGWWVVQFHIDAAAGCDSVSFNLSL
jgi:hypothetical protein